MKPIMKKKFLHILQKVLTYCFFTNIFSLFLESFYNGKRITEDPYETVHTDKQSCRYFVSGFSYCNLQEINTGK
jgi:hypothetical protein